MRDRKVLIAIIILVLIIIGLLFGVTLLLKDKGKMTALEEVKINEFTNEIIDYAYVYDNKDLSIEEKKIEFAIEYYQDQKINEISFDDIVKFVNKYFDKKIKKDDIEQVGVTPEIARLGVAVDYTKNIFNNNRKYTQSDIASIPLYKYIINNVKRLKNNEYEVTYDKYIIDNPYKLYNYYVNNSTEYNYDTSKIQDYLFTKESKVVLKEFLTEKVVKEIGKNEGTIKVVIKCKDASILIKSIEV